MILCKFEIQLLFMKHCIIVLAAIILLSCKKHKENVLTITVTPPVGHINKDTISIYGSFNDWDLQKDTYILKTTANNELTVQIPITEAPIFFNFSKNKNYGSTAATLAGKKKCDYIYQISNKKEIHITIDAWTGEKAIQKPPHTLTRNITYIKDFDMSPLKRVGDIAIYLPHGYDNHPEKNYPVLYMLDGQNVFDTYTAFSDEWKVDETIEELTVKKMIDGLIVVAIPNGKNRWSEYNPWDFKDWNGDEQQGQGEETFMFIKETLIPYINTNYRTIANSEFTGIGGSSLGGSMALYAGIAHSDTFGFIAAFSPGLAVENKAGENTLFTYLKTKQGHNNNDTKIYFDMGKMEYGDYAKIEALEGYLKNIQGVKEEKIIVVKDDLGRHCELDWSRRFKKPILWWLNKK